MKKRRESFSFLAGQKNQFHLSLPQAYKTIDLPIHLLNFDSRNVLEAIERVQAQIQTLKVGNRTPRWSVFARGSEKGGREQVRNQIKSIHEKAKTLLAFPTFFPYLALESRTS
ncbi:MAG: hypothetical protein NWR72_13795 [Bacteroidia bacterium]|nr:hypothetical protein [Bacteroidia bacterium]